MEPITVHTGLAFPLDRSNVDTDQIIPKQFLKRIERQGFGQFLFYNWRFDHDGNPIKEFPLHDGKYTGASILLAGDNFGCGSSREHAPWALLDYGFKIVIAPSFADIFKNNCVKNGILAIEMPYEELQPLMQKAESGNLSLTVDLGAQTVTDADGFSYQFDIAEYSKEMLYNGLDDIGITLLYEEKITEFESRQ
ncbi:3-isopropylmalate dehydratase small subunit [Bacillus sp. B-jedd]|uniref:3-isopropylmalate dehydratase small subunit n=1 Tax=Bacillus sp. B-jedd TaxID=1476857 RepID=UPI0005156C7C|nr:3-isopropylmalate dehydratase small subunit [Bacillus sp. B-jedd]CEG25795.1 3-isopropylmalate dehydratase, small subunit [Bacillus sp. B-jedd]